MSAIDLRLFTSSENAHYESLVTAGVAGGDPALTALMSPSGALVANVASPREVVNKYQLAKALQKQLDDLLGRRPELREEPCLWNALTVKWSPHIWGKGAEQRSEYLVFRGSGRDRYRHRLAGPYFLLKRFGEARHIERLLKALAHDAHGDFLEQLLGRQYVFISDAAWEAAARLYLATDGTIKRGALGRGAGSVRRFGVVLQQLAVTYDTSILDPDSLMRLLPAEFERFGP